MAHPSLGPGSHGRRRERNLQTSPTRSPGRARDVYHDAAAAAAQRGCEKAYSLEGGVVAWADAGLPIERS